MLSDLYFIPRTVEIQVKVLSWMLPEDFLKMTPAVVGKADRRIWEVNQGLSLSTRHRTNVSQKREVAVARLPVCGV